MRTYYVSKNAYGTLGETISAANIEDLRKKLIRKHGKKMEVYVFTPHDRMMVLRAFFYYHENESWRYDANPSGYYWKNSNGTRRVSIKTGRLLDVNSHTRRL